jgi:predicted membrane channel-forming protein YqfA (hemolysin III family)
MLVSFVILLLAGQFFVNGLKEKNDYLRLNHGFWHMFAGVAHYYGMSCATCN